MFSFEHNLTSWRLTLQITVNHPDHHCVCHSVMPLANPISLVVDPSVYGLDQATVAQVSKVHDDFADFLCDAWFRGNIVLDRR